MWEDSKMGLENTLAESAIVDHVVVRPSAELSKLLPRIGI